MIVEILQAHSVFGCYHRPLGSSGEALFGRIGAVMTVRVKICATSSNQRHLIPRSTVSLVLPVPRHNK